MLVSVIVISAGPHWDRLTSVALDGLKYHASKPIELIVVDNGGSGRGDINLPDMVPYGMAVNMGAQRASGDRLLILNNDIIVRGDYLATLRGDVALAGPTIRIVHRDVAYVEGWAISIAHWLWDLLGGFDINLKNSWEDVDLSWRSSILGHSPQHIGSFPIYHIYNGTRQYHKGANRWDAENEEYFSRKRLRYANRKHDGV